MKKIIIVVGLLLTLSAGTTFVLVRKSSKVGLVSENPNIPTFITTFMEKERHKLKMSCVQNEVSKEQRLTNLGFPSKPGVGMRTDYAIAVDYLMNIYDSIYPKNQFINFSCLEKVINDNKLELGTTSTFIGEVPDYAIKDMENFKPGFLYNRWSGTSDGRNTLWEFRDGLSIVATWGNGYGGIDTYIGDTWNRIRAGKGALGAETDLMKYSKMDLVQRCGQKSFLIIAPANYFSDKANALKVHGAPKDPIVLYPVDGGYLIVTSW